MKYALAVGLGFWWLGMATPSHAIDAAKLFSEKCAVCHGTTGGGTATGTAQKGDVFIMTGKPADLKRVIMKGRSGAAKLYPNIPVDMPKGLVSDAEADALVKFLQGDLQK